MIPAKTISGIPGIVAGFTEKSMGDMRLPENRIRAVNDAGFPAERIVVARQVHGVSVKIIETGDFGSVIAGVDGMVADPRMVGTVVLFVRGADCTPVLLADAKTKRIGVAHAGWKGTLGGIGGRLVRAMMTLGSDPSDLRAAVGPHIGPCCYEVDAARCGSFRDRFGNLAVATGKNGKPAIDLAAALVSDLTSAGMSESAIDLSSGYCTYDDPERFFSFRRDPKVLFGEIAGMIGVQYP